MLLFRQHYYPEGGWGWVIVTVAFLVKSIVQGFQMAHGVLLASMARRFLDEDNDEATFEAAAGKKIAPGNPDVMY